MHQLLGWQIRFRVAWLAICCGALLTPLARAQQQAADLKKPIAMTMHRGTGYAFVVEKGADQLTRWDGEQVTAVVSTLSGKPTELETIVGATFRDRNCVTLIGYAKDDAATSRVATYRISADGKLTFDLGH